jgi:hypothetical protein
MLSRVVKTQRVGLRSLHAVRATSVQHKVAGEAKTFMMPKEVQGVTFNSAFLSLAKVASQVEADAEFELERTIQCEAKNKKVRRVIKKKRKKKGINVNMRRS